ncbi:hypothetical protein [Streptomyces soliscabiei]|uniref:hypothetical protein n=1 Tax=Streptomyces soliscabiei TaxID=588897 RepID=UPI0029A26E6F|nr:hypothetical protein [Streptomyces sp. NY05-11A]MDX2676190.1 hypothetical protein [Streptomyces sp. NY05-11A]
MTHTETAERLAAAEDEIRTLRAELSALRRAAAETRVMVLLAAQETPEAREILRALTSKSSDFGVPQTSRPAARGHLRLVHAADSVSGHEMDEALRRVRGTGAR